MSGHLSRLAQSQSVLRAVDFSRYLSWAKLSFENLGLLDQLVFESHVNDYTALSAEGVMISMISTIRHSEQLAFIGNFMTDPEYRHKGYGSMLWTMAAFETMNYQSVGLYSTMEQVSIFQNYDFRPDHTVARYVRELKKPTIFDPKYRSKFQFSYHPDLLSIVELDARAFSVGRAKYWELLASDPDVTFLSAYDSGLLRGFAAVAPVRSGLQIAPLYAENSEVAINLMNHFWSLAPDSEFNTVHIDVREDSPYAVDLVKSFGFAKTLEKVGMFAGRVPEKENELTCGIASFSMG